jgi:hypothetical protein
MPIYIVGHSDYDSYDPHYVSHPTTFSKEEFRELVDFVVGRAASYLLVSRKAEIAKGQMAWYISWDNVVGKAVEILCKEYGFTSERFVTANYFGGIINDEGDRCSNGHPVIPVEVMQYNIEIRDGRMEKYERKVGCRLP